MPRSRTKVLFVALSASTHTHSWVSLLDKTSFDVRLFGLPITAKFGEEVPVDSSMPHWRSLAARVARKVFGDRYLNRYQTSHLARVISAWKPDLVHTLGLDPASYNFLDARNAFPSLAAIPWIVTARGGPELSLSRLIPEEARRIRQVLGACDQFVADNELNYVYAQELGLARARVSPLGVVPGTGGVDVDELAALRRTPASSSRVVLFPKAYECPASKALPVFEALRIAWDTIHPCEIHLTALIPETRMWLATLPESIQRSCRLYDRIPRPELLSLMARARVVLAPSLTDGIPNTLYETMALGAVPIVSPIDTLREKFADHVNVVYARNLYPQEIAQALITAMGDDPLVDTIAANNQYLVRQLADREKIRTRVADWYASIARTVGGTRRDQ